MRDARVGRIHGAVAGLLGAVAEVVVLAGEQRAAQLPEMRREAAQPDDALAPRGHVGADERAGAEIDRAIAVVEERQRRRKATERLIRYGEPARRRTLPSRQH